MVGRFTVAGTTLTITDNDIPPTVIELSVNSGDVVDPTRVTEDSGTATVMVTAAFPAGSPMLTTAIDVVVTVAGGTAEETADFTATPATLTVTIPAESTSGMVTGSFDLAVVDDGDDELDETVTVSGMVLGTTTITSIPSATLTITDDDDRPVVDDVDITPSVLESAGGSAMATFTVTLRTRGYRETTVTMGVSLPSNRSGLATDGVDYTLDWPGPISDEFVITVQPDELTGTGVFSLSVAEDDIVEGNEGIGFTRLRVNGVVSGCSNIPRSPEDRGQRRGDGQSGQPNGG